MDTRTHTQTVCVPGHIRQAMYDTNTTCTQWYDLQLLLTSRVKHLKKVHAQS